ncbi:deaminase [Pseudofrankia inefficax]|uniref:CMP/dCMP deaminase zinc-binding protein n=1 Tax=Pseudofrankia inefficax (strain DSM 45817 / CECT 9037 / DDB 130130 / EuI1c) TaxID=298654 RepID=E3IZC8_PSEI1|nr:deaminase [Pseudofrankia inefficax]ADP81555.1 CMP/dCMP deaminase zinc-binding protein [Pseudofrankia inefficax]
MAEKRTATRRDTAGCQLGLAEHLRTPELVFGIVRTVGTEIAPVVQELHAALAAANYLVFRIDLDTLLAPLVSSPDTPADEPTRRELLMDAGDRLRDELGRADGVALAGVREIHRIRGDASVDHTRPRAFVLDGLSHKAEVETLRQVYGRRAFFIAADAPRPERARLLAQLFERSSGLDATDAERAATHAVDRDFGLATSLTAPPVGRGMRLSSSAALERCDLFVRCDDPTQTRRHVRRLVECIHSHPFHTLTMDELGMAAAYRGSLTTAVLARRVGTAIMVDEQIVAVGANEVPKAGGGYYHTESQPDGREFMAGLDASDGIRAQILADLLARLRPGWFTPELQKRTIAELTQLAINDEDIRDADLFDVIEYGRTTHAEMVAITSAARRGIAIGGGTLYSTTLPCHECTRNIIASGLARVVYLEPYQKSKGGELHRDAIDLFPEPVSPRPSHAGPTGRPDRVSIEPFSGFSHNRLSDLFSWVPRKADDVRRTAGEPIRLDGRAVIWRAHEAALRPSISDPAFAETDGLTRLVTEMRVLAALPDGRPRADCAPLADLEALLDRIAGTLDGTAP